MFKANNLLAEMKTNTKQAAECKIIIFLFVLKSYSPTYEYKIFRWLAL